MLTQQEINQKTYEHKKFQMKLIAHLLRVIKFLKKHFEEYQLETYFQRDIRVELELAEKWFFHSRKDINYPEVRLYDERDLFIISVVSGHRIVLPIVDLLTKTNTEIKAQVMPFYSGTRVIFPKEEQK